MRIMYHLAAIAHDGMFAICPWAFSTDQVIAVGFPHIAPLLPHILEVYIYGLEIKLRQPVVEGLNPVTF